MGQDQSRYQEQQQQQQQQQQRQAVPSGKGAAKGESLNRAAPPEKDRALAEWERPAHFLEVASLAAVTEGYEAAVMPADAVDDSRSSSLSDSSITAASPEAKITRDKLKERQRELEKSWQETKEHVSSYNESRPSVPSEESGKGTGERMSRTVQEAIEANKFKQDQQDAKREQRERLEGNADKSRAQSWWDVARTKLHIGQQQNQQPQQPQKEPLTEKERQWTPGSTARVQQQEASHHQAERQQWYYGLGDYADNGKSRDEAGGPFTKPQPPEPPTDEEKQKQMPSPSSDPPIAQAPKTLPGTYLRQPEKAQEYRSSS